MANFVKLHTASDGDEILVNLDAARTIRREALAARIATEIAFGRDFQVYVRESLKDLETMVVGAP